jgi:uncharacterized protein (UPF0335 family)
MSFEVVLSSELRQHIEKVERLVLRLINLHERSCKQRYSPMLRNVDKAVS